MQLQALITALLSALPLSLAAPVEERDFRQKSYPVELKTTPAKYGFFLRVDATRPAYNNRNVQAVGGPKAPFLTAVIDESSPVVAGRLQNGVLATQNVVFGDNEGPTGRYASLGPKIAYNNNKLFLQEFRFSLNNTDTGPDESWVLDNITNGGGYWLYHLEADGVANGFVICRFGADGPTFYKLYYATYSRGPGKIPAGCEYIALETTIAPIDFPD